MPLEDAAAYLGDENTSAGRGLLAEAVLWTPGWCSLRALPDGFASTVRARYKGVLERIVNDRAGHVGTVISMKSSSPRELELLDIEVTSALDEVSPGVRRYMRPFASLATKLYWAFRVLGLEAIASKAAKATVMHAMRSHADLIQKALSQAEIQRVEQLAKRIKTVLRQKGPCTARQLQRSIFQSKQSDIETGLERLLSNGQIVFAQAKREYHVPAVVDAGESRSAANRTSALAGPLHG
jgi:hypothetical protein